MHDAVLLSTAPVMFDAMTPQEVDVDKEEVVESPQKVDADEKEVVDKLGQRLQMDAHISSLEAQAAHPHSQLRSSAHPTSPPQGMHVQMALL